jgi:hypothetical protein
MLTGGLSCFLDHNAVVYIKADLCFLPSVKDCILHLFRIASRYSAIMRTDPFRGWRYEDFVGFRKSETLINANRTAISGFPGMNCRRPGAGCEF